MLGCLFLGTPAERSCEGSSDVLGQGGRALLDWDADQELALTDAVDVLLYLFQSGRPHAPGTECTHAEGCGPSCGG